MFKLGDLLIFVTGKHHRFQGFGRHVGFVWEGLVSWSWEPSYLCFSDAQIPSQKAYLAKRQRVNLSSIWFKFFRKPFIHPGSYVTSVSRWLRRLTETAQASRLMRTDSFILTVLVQSKYSDATHLGRHHGGGRMWPRTTVHITKDRKKSSEECWPSASILFIFLPYFSWATSHR